MGYRTVKAEVNKDGKIQAQTLVTGNKQQAVVNTNREFVAGVKQAPFAVKVVLDKAGTSGQGSCLQHGENTVCHNIGRGFKHTEGMLYLRVANDVHQALFHIIISRKIAQM